MKYICLYSLFAVCLVILLGAVCLTKFLLIHKISQVDDIPALLQTYHSPNVNDRCKQYNVTHYRCLPNVFIIGASKAGTTTLVNYLKTIPTIHFLQRGLANKYDHHDEIHRFDRESFQDADKRIELYHEWTSSPLVQHPDKDIIIHYTPHYLYAPSVPFELHDFYPVTALSNMTFILLLRDPWERSLSSYWFKNSHLFHQKDQGSYEEFINLTKNEMYYRIKYERCILNEYDWSTNRTQQQLSAGAVTTATSPTPTTTAAYLQLLHHLFICNDDTSTNNSSSNHLLDDNVSHWQRWHHQPSANKLAYHIQHLPASSSCPPTTQKTDMKRKHFQALQTCFGTKLFRHGSLGLRHLDKSIYLDQLIRWLLVFPPEQFIVLSSAAMLAQPERTIQYLLGKLQVYYTLPPTDEGQGQSTSAKTKKKEKKMKNKLVRPNALQSVEQSKNKQVDREWEMKIRDYFNVYDRELFRHYLQ